MPIRSRCGTERGPLRAGFTESMFARQPDASKAGFVMLSYYLQRWGFAVNDGKRDSEHLRSLGFRLIPRKAFNALLAQACNATGRPGLWTIDSTADIAEWQPEAGRQA